MTTKRKKWTLAAVIATAAVSMVAGCTSSGAMSPAPSNSTKGAVAAGAPIPSAGCATPAAAPVTDLRQDVEVDGTARWYLLTTPSPRTPSPTSTSSIGGAPVPRPLVLDFHGLAEGATIHSTTTHFGALGQKDGFVVAFPNGTGVPVQWNTTARGAANPDLTYVTAVLGQIEAGQCIDTSRIYASGFSDGSFMVSLLACTMSDKFAAIAAVSGLQLPKPCRTTRHVPIITFHGTADPILFFNGGIGTATLNRILGVAPSTSPSSTTTTQPAKLHGSGYPATVQAWAVKDGCQPRAQDTRVSSQVVLRTYQCPSGTDVEFTIILGGGHSWPGSAFSRSISSITGFTTFQINATDTIWAFFRRFRL
jgi:polyhydroxybutyrate depolymerase